MRMRLARFGRKSLPFYRIMVADARAKRDGKHVEKVGWYDPTPGKDGNKHMSLNRERIQYWLSVGAQPSRAVERLLGRVGILPPAPLRMSQNQGVSKAELRERAKGGQA